MPLPAARSDRRARGATRQIPKLCKLPTKASNSARRSSLSDRLAEAAPRPLCCGVASSIAEGRHLLSEAAQSVGGGAAIGHSQAAHTAVDGVEGLAGQLIRRVLQASQDRDPLDIQVQLDEAAKVLGLAGCLDKIVLPATRQLHQLLTAGQRDGTQDRMATEAVRTWLNHRGAFAPPPQEIGPILLACGPRDRDTIKLESLALLLRFQRWPCRVLGARVPTFNLTVAAQAADASGVVVIANEIRNQRHAIVSVLAVDALGIPVFLGGNAFEAENLPTKLPGRLLGTSLEAACSLLIDTLAPAVQRRAAANHHR